MSQPKEQSKDKRGRGRQSQGRDVQVSKALSKLLRHAAEKEGLKMNEQGYASVTDVVCSTLYQFPG
jgi:2'-phosphotransferase